MFFITLFLTVFNSAAVFDYSGKMQSCVGLPYGVAESCEASVKAELQTYCTKKAEEFKTKCPVGFNTAQETLAQVHELALARVGPEDLMTKKQLIIGENTSLCKKYCSVPALEQELALCSADLIAEVKATKVPPSAFEISDFSQQTLVTERCSTPIIATKMEMAFRDQLIEDGLTTTLSEPVEPKERGKKIIDGKEYSLRCAMTDHGFEACLATPSDGSKSILAYGDQNKGYYSDWNVAKGSQNGDDCKQALSAAKCKEVFHEMTGGQIKTRLSYLPGMGETEYQCRQATQDREVCTLRSQYTGDKLKYFMYNPESQELVPITTETNVKTAALPESPSQKPSSPLLASPSPSPAPIVKTPLVEKKPIATDNTTEPQPSTPPPSKGDESVNVAGGGTPTVSNPTGLNINSATNPYDNSRLSNSPLNINSSSNETTSDGDSSSTASPYSGGMIAGNYNGNGSSRGISSNETTSGNAVSVASLDPTNPSSLSATANLSQQKGSQLNPNGTAVNGLTMPKIVNGPEEFFNIPKGLSPAARAKAIAQAKAKLKAKGGRGHGRSAGLSALDSCKGNKLSCFISSLMGSSNQNMKKGSRARMAQSDYYTGGGPTRLPAGVSRGTSVVFQGVEKFHNTYIILDENGEISPEE